MNLLGLNGKVVADGQVNGLWIPDAHLVQTLERYSFPPDQCSPRPGAWFGEQSPFASSASFPMCGPAA